MIVHGLFPGVHVRHDVDGGSNLLGPVDEQWHWHHGTHMTPMVQHDARNAAHHANGPTAIRQVVTRSKGLGHLYTMDGNQQNDRMTNRFFFLFFFFCVLPSACSA